MEEKIIINEIDPKEAGSGEPTKTVLHQIKRKLTKFKKYKKLLNNLGLFFVAVLVVFALANLVLAGIINFDLKKKEALLKEKNRPADLELTVIGQSSCQDCFNLSPIIDSLTSKNARIVSKKSLELNSTEAQGLVKKYGIKKAPTFLVSGELTKNNDLKQLFKDQGEIKDGTFIFTKVKPPYLLADTGEEKGEVVVTYLKDSTCSACQNLTDLITKYKSATISIKDVKTVEAKSSEGQDLIKKFNLKKIPTLIFSPALSAYDEIVASLDRYDLVAASDSYLLKEVLPPYLDLATGQVKGLANLTLISDTSCQTCYNVNNHLPILKGFGIVPEKTETVDVASSKGERLIKKYKITQVPTFILTGEVNLYSGLVGIWNQVGTVESDGAYVFRQAKLMGNYRDLTSGQIVNPQATNQNSNSNSNSK